MLHSASSCRSHGLEKKLIELSILDEFLSLQGEILLSAFSGYNHTSVHIRGFAKFETCACEKNLKMSRKGGDCFKTCSSSCSKVGVREEGRKEESYKA